MKDRSTSKESEFRPTTYRFHAVTGISGPRGQGFGIIRAVRLERDGLGEPPTTRSSCS